MIGIYVEGPSYTYGDNQSVLANMAIPDATLKNKSQCIACHFVRKGVSRDEWRTAYVNTDENATDPLTKTLATGIK